MATILSIASLLFMAAVSPAAMALPVQDETRARAASAPAEVVPGEAHDDAAEPGRWIVAFAADQEAALRGAGVGIWDRENDLVIASADEAQLVDLARHSIAPVLTIADRGEMMYILSHHEGFTGPSIPAAAAYVLSSTADLYLFPAELSFELPRVKPYGGFRGVPRVPLPPIKLHEADAGLKTTEPGAAPASAAAAASRQTLTVNPLVTQIVNATSQTNWYQYVSDLSGENSVVIGGNTYTIRTRYSYAMYPTPALNARATEYLLDKAAGWGYTGVRETYTSANSGCGAQSSNVWQNLVFTLPGQVDFGQHQQVLFVTHHDSLSFSSAESFNYAPGADDAISGGSALIEALRLFKDYGFKNTVKIIFFSGEEQGLCGSIAYTRQPQHPASDIWRVVNMDQTAYDGNRNGWMNCYNWDAVSSPGSVALGDAFVQANADYGPIITPANIFRPTNKMCQTDHCPFWNVGVAAIAVLEDLTHNEICPCFDQSQTATCHDTVTQDDPTHPGQLMFDQNYSWPSQKAALATIAHLAEPLYACPASAPALTATPAIHTVGLSWSAAPGVTNYVVERAASCAGPFTGVASATGTSYDDSGLTNGTTYAYRIRTCPNQVSACMTATPNGPSVVYQAGSAAITADSGDQDALADNCELVTVQVNVVNDGNVPLTGVKLAAVSSTHPGVQVATAIPQVIGSLGLGASAPASFKFYLARNGNPAACGAALPFTITVTSNESAPDTKSFSLSAERDQSAGVSASWGFETDMSGWTVTAGSFTRVAGGASGSTAFSLHSRNINNDCDAIVSPTFTPTSTSSLIMSVNYSIEGNGSTTNIYDRAVIRAVNTITSAKTLLVPILAPYTTTGCGGVTLCDGLCNLQGYAGSATTWRQGLFDLGSLAGVPIQIEVRFSTDTGALGTQGFWFDAVFVTDACDTQTNACSALPPEVSPDAAPVQFTLGKSGGGYDLRFSEEADATAYNIYGGSLVSLHAGGYDHAAAGGLCSLTDATPGDGQVTASVAAATFPENSYLLAVARNGAGESIYGLTSTGATIPIALSSCP